LAEFILASVFGFLSGLGFRPSDFIFGYWLAELRLLIFG